MFESQRLVNSASGLTDRSVAAISSVSQEWEFVTLVVLLGLLEKF